ncbi:MAG: FAD-dependent oxidoreductase [Eubacteriales bacterium]|nr:FAD-dependent oxidoreductase [Eubacteriales bacterium]
MKFLWTEDIEKPSFNKLNKDIETDVLIIGGGMAGILCAIALRDAGADYMLVEAKAIGSGITKGTTAVISAQHDTLYSDLIEKYGRGRAKQYLDANLAAVSRFRQLSENIPCDYEVLPSVMYSTDDALIMRKEAEAVQSLGFNAEFKKEAPIPVKIEGAVSYPGMGQFHPLKFLYGAAAGLNIYENTFVHKLDKTTAYTDGGTIKAKKVIVASHFPFINRRGIYFIKMYQMRSFVIALEKAEKLGCTLVEHSGEGMYFRNYNDLLIVGGGDRKTSKKSGGFEAVRRFIKHYYKNTVEKYVWATQDCMSLDGVPYIGAYSKSMPDVYVATGFNEWGMTSSMVASMILTDMITGKTNPYGEVFSPQRTILHPQLFANAGSAAVNLATPSCKRCPHLGCALKWNEEEKSWDCPCHGSRFDESGKLIDNPAMRDANVR